MRPRPLRAERGGRVRGRLVAAALALTATVGCGSSGERPPPRQAPLPAVDAAALPSHGLVAVLTAPSTKQGAVYETVALVRPGSGIVNSATFVPRQPPYAGESEAILPPAAVVAAGAVWVLDGSGAVLRLGPSGPAQRVATLPVPAPGTASLAVSPDGSELVSSAYDGRSIVVRAARLGGPARVLRTIDSPSRRPVLTAGDPSETVALVEAWDEVGPVEALHPPAGAQDYAPLGFQSPIANIDVGTGRPLGQTIGGSGCYALDELLNGATLCGGLASNIAATPEVHTRAGDLLYAAPVPASTIVSPRFSPRISPDGSRVAMALEAETLPPSSGGPAPAAVAGYDGKTARLPQGCEPVGWADVAVVVCAPVPTNDVAPGTGPLGVVDLAAPGMATPLGVSGVFLGAL